MNIKIWGDDIRVLQAGDHIEITVPEEYGIRLRNALCERFGPPLQVRAAAARTGATEAEVERLKADLAFERERADDLNMKCEQQFVALGRLKRKSRELEERLARIRKEVE